MGPRQERYLAGVAAALADLLGPDLVGVYLHGSAVLGGFDTRRSDIDVIAVCGAPMTAAQQTAATEALSERRLPCPAHGLEFSAVTLQTAAHPTAAPAFELHLTTAPQDAKVVDGHVSGPDADLVLHFAVCGRAGRLVGPGLPAAEVFAPAPRCERPVSGRAAGEAGGPAASRGPACGRGSPAPAPAGWPP